ncbi:MAG TPA: class IV adenylate cyclase [Bryobacteraceae bacterium]|nr:class IV adenylate cyclase [Bryobacteraceae bacterium]
MAQTYREIEIKLPLPGAAQGRKLLRRAGFAVWRRRVFEQNVLYDTPAADLRRAHTGLRVRTCGGRNILTFKGPPFPGKHKDREEFETEFAADGAMREILRRLGYAPVFRYEKYRTEFRQGRSRSRAMLDETPVGVFLELEGSPRWIDRTARALGFTETDYITTSYAELFRKEQRRKGVKE